jgi:hypothetical protein
VGPDLLSEDFEAMGIIAAEIFSYRSSAQLRHDVGRMIFVVSLTRRAPFPRFGAAHPSD